MSLNNPYALHWCKTQSFGLVRLKKHVWCLKQRAHRANTIGVEIQKEAYLYHLFPLDSTWKFKLCILGWKPFHHLPRWPTSLGTLKGYARPFTHLFSEVSSSRGIAHFPYTSGKIYNGPTVHWAQKNQACQKFQINHIFSDKLQFTWNTPDNSQIFPNRSATQSVATS